MLGSAPRTTFNRPDRRTISATIFTTGRARLRRAPRLAVVVAFAACALWPPAPTAGQQANMTTTVASLGAGTASSRITLDSINANPATDRGLALPSLTLTDDGKGLRVNHLVLELPDLGRGDVLVASRLGDQPLPALFRAGPLAGPALAAPIRGLTFSTAGSVASSLSLGQIGSGPYAGPPDAGAPALAAAAVSFTPNHRLSLTPKVLLPVGWSDAQRSIGTAVQTHVPGNLALVTDVGVTGTAASAWSPLASARLVGTWPRAGIETSVLRGSGALPTETHTAWVPSHDREAAQAHVQPLPGLTLAALTSASRPATDPGADDTLFGSLRLAYDGLPAGQLAAVRQRETAPSRESEVTSLEWRQRGPGRMVVRYVQQRASDSALAGATGAWSRVEVDLPALAPRSASGLDLRAAITAGSSSWTAPGVNSKVSGRVGRVGTAALTGETELGIPGGAGQLLRALRVTTEMPVIPTTRLQLAYSYRAGARFPVGQLFEARILRRLDLGW